MLLPPAHAWTKSQRCLIAGAVLLVSIAVGTLIYQYERYHRGPAEDSIYGTWQDSTAAMDSAICFQFKPDHTVLYLLRGADDLTMLAKGRWYVGGEKIYFWLKDILTDEQIFVIWRIEEIEPNELTVRYLDYLPTRYIRVELDGHS